ncbi:hypothetical protein V4C53_30185 [Paraburkholderia azotifigens]|uniref:hypothetical protein n=1 Tax=Paraburkholderia azotifigens TaxID=2057004 RepID=UPI00317F5464
MNADKLADIAVQFGKDVAYRAFMDFKYPRGSEERTLSMFYAAPKALADDPLPEYDPFGFSAFYKDSPTSSVIRSVYAYWVDALVRMREYWGEWVTEFLYVSLILGESHEVFDRIADDQGECSEDGAMFCWWFPEWKGWSALASGLTDNQMFGLRLVLTGDYAKYKGHTRHPDPGSPEAEAYMNRGKKEIEQ